jgi:hypothetical protein
MAAARMPLDIRQSWMDEIVVRMLSFQKPRNRSRGVTCHLAWTMRCMGVGLVASQFGCVSIVDSRSGSMHRTMSRPGGSIISQEFIDGELVTPLFDETPNFGAQRAGTLSAQGCDSCRAEPGECRCASAASVPAISEMGGHARAATELCYFSIRSWLCKPGEWIAKKKAEANAPPWPRFHPLPVREVFSPEEDAAAPAPEAYGQFGKSPQ